MRTPEEQKAWEKQCYGIDNIDDFQKSVEESFVFKLSGPGMVLISMLSDVQEQIASGSDEDARQTVNRVKFLIDLYLPSKVKG